MTATQPAASETASILIVDDMEENLVALEAVLGSLGHVVRAHSGEEALKAMLRQQFAVVLIDVLMPGMNGFETAANIKGLDQTKDVPIILLTGAAVDPNYAYRGYTVGAADFLIKPFDPWLLRTKVNVFLDLFRKNRQLMDQSEQLKRLLTADGGRPTVTPSTPPPTCAATEPSYGTDGKETTDSPERPAHPDDADRLSEVVGQLAQAELLLRDANGPSGADLADRIVELEQAVGRLMAKRET
ncbi:MULTISPECIES: response regulator [unclassified Streptomyces]|uniref:response regulator n=1 Tax=unclassified Streptomyces TaxID=2593676 RepID=UPI002DDB92D0|nr:MULTISPECIES: response regulator [unclassified Streptomyces]WSF82820.1 response regulator [Streptomyces sp. NBC_01744]WSC40920.1 response regulator [Streptomyces sp. NBC_01763]WSC49043.1 response regulator [Streptomyces sp. NBC_01762]WSC51972.1 response regulator [Streptomyces sp. NBC_01761]WSD28707.1 response regulator [Streptomyces sp. NBC_01751]